MEFDESYFKARADAVKWLKRAPERRDFNEGVALLDRMRFKPLLTHRLKLCSANPVMRRVLVQAVTDGINVYRNPSSPKFADTIPAEVEEATSGTLPPSPEEEEDTDPSNDTAESPKFAAYPDTIRQVVKWYSDAYKRRDRLHRELRSVGEGNGATLMARRKALSDLINMLTDYMDELYPLKEDFDTTGTVPDEERLTAIGSFDLWSSRHASGSAEPSSAKAASFRKNGEDFSAMSAAELRSRRRNIRTQLVKKQNRLLYQTDGRQEKENPMPHCPERVRIERQVAALKEKLYQADMALAKLG